MMAYASTRRLPPHLTQANTSKSNVLLSHSAPSTRGIFSFIGSLLAAAWGATLASSAPAWGSTGVGNEWTVELAACGKKVQLKSWKGDYLHRPDTAKGVTSWGTGVGNEWAMEVVP